MTIEMDSGVNDDVKDLPLTVTARMALAEERVLDQLGLLKREIIALANLPERVKMAAIAQDYEERLQALKECHRVRKERRDRRRVECRETLQGKALEKALGAIAKESRQDSTERRQLKREREQVIRPLRQMIDRMDEQMKLLRKEYKGLSKWWQGEMQAIYFSEMTAAQQAPLDIVYGDDYLIGVDKPAGLLSEPGRYYHLQDSVLSRLRHQLPEQSFLRPVHRLDQATSGLLLFALSAGVHAALSQQFARQKVVKTYEAILSRPVDRAEGVIELSLYADPIQRPKQRVDAQRGKHSKTAFRVVKDSEFPHVEFRPHTGRTHQLRVHAAHPDGLKAPILGDALYGFCGPSQRLYLHAVKLAFMHPANQSDLIIRSTCSLFESS
ncbi:MAG: RluA family pseudouridine synthase [Cyanobacteria bacterium J06560_5]